MSSTIAVHQASKRSTQHTTTSSLINTYALDRIDYHVKRLGRGLHLSEHQREDLRQDLTLDLCKAARRYDPSKSSPRTFVSRVLTWAALHRARCIRNERQCAARSPIHLSQLQRENRGFAPLAPRTSEPSAHDLVLDLRQGFARLSRRQQQTAEALKNQSVAEIAAQHRAHRSTVYRDLGSMRATLSELGLNPGS